MIQECRINRNKKYGVWVNYNSKGTIENCDLTDNGKSGLDIESGCLVQQSGNKQ